MKTIIYFLPFLLFVIYSCADNASDNESVDTFPANTSQENILKMSDFIESVQYIPLETNDSCLIGEISDIFPLQDEMVFVDRKYALSIYFYDYNGLFKRKISKRGVGPEEYIKISSVAISEKESHIYLYDAYLNKVLVYNFQGQYVDGHKIPFKFSSMAYLGNGIFVMGLKYSDIFSQKRIPDIEVISGSR